MVGQESLATAGPGAGSRGSLRRRIAWGLGPAVIAIALLATLGPAAVHPGAGQLGSGPAPPPTLSPPPPLNATNNSTAYPLTGSSSCNPVSTPTPSAVLIPVAAPASSLGNGGTISVGYQVALVNYTTANFGTRVVLPSVFATFPLSTGAAYQFFFGARSLYVNGSGWTAGASVNSTATPRGGLSFNANVSDVLSTQKIAVMTPGNYGTTTVEIRWSWTLVQPSGSVVAGGWSTPTRAAHWPSALPSIFYPAPYASLQSSSGAKVTIGTNYSATLGGNVASRYFFLELEYPGSGKVVQAQAQTGPAGATSLRVVIMMLNYDKYLAPGTYLVHIHDGCGAMLYSLSVVAYFAPHATVQFFVSPTLCGPVTFNGSKYSNAANATVRPSTTPFSIALSGCNGHKFQSWGATGGIHVTSGSTMLVSASGTFTVKYS